MDKNTIIGLVLMIGLLVAYQFMNKPSEAEMKRQQEMADSLKQAQTITIEEEKALPVVVPNVVADSATQAIQNQALSQRYGIFSPSMGGEGQIIELSNGLYTAQINTKGGFFTQVDLSEAYRAYWDSSIISLWDPSLNEQNIALTVPGTGMINTNEMVFEPTMESSGDGQKLTLTARTARPDSYIQIIYETKAESYKLESSINFIGLEDVLAQSPKGIPMTWKTAGWHNEKAVSYERQHSSVFYREMEGDRDYLGEARADDEIIEDPLNWVAYKQFFFSAAIISPEGFNPGSSIESYPPENEADTLHNMMYASELLLPTKAEKAESVPLSYYFGPNELVNLTGTEVAEFGRIIDYGWGIFGWVNRNMIRPMFTWLSGMNLGYGVIILLITLAIKMLLFPVTWKNYLSSAKMRVLKPDIEEINKKYEGKDAMEKQQAVMGLYKKTGVNPVAGCLPMLLQMPILYAMFRFFPSTIELRQESFLWAEDLVNYDSILKLPFEIPFYGAHVSGFTLLMAASTFFYTQMNSGNMAQPTQPGMPNMKVIMYIFPFMMLFFFNQYASGLSLYYLLANVISIIQMWVIKKYIIDEDKIRAKIDSNKTKKRGKSKWSQRLEEAQRLQQDRLKQKKAK